MSEGPAVAAFRKQIIKVQLQSSASLATTYLHNQQTDKNLPTIHLRNILSPSSGYLNKLQVSFVNNGFLDANISISCVKTGQESQEMEGDQGL